MIILLKTNSQKGGSMRNTYEEEGRRIYSLLSDVGMENVNSGARFPAYKFMGFPVLVSPYEGSMRVKVYGAGV